MPYLDCYSAYGPLYRIQKGFKRRAKSITTHTSVQYIMEFVHMVPFILLSLERVGH